MKLSSIPVHPAYVVFHDGCDNGAMEVFPRLSFSAAQKEAEQKQEQFDAMGYEDGMWRAYSKLPRCKVWKYHTEVK